MFEVGENILGKYLIQSELKPGNFGKVFIVHNFGLNQKSVLKVAEVDDPNSFKEIIEAYSQNLCNHEHILKIFTAEVIQVATPDGQRPAIAMELEFADGGSVSDRIAKQYVPLKESVEILIDCLFALEFSHSKEIIHGDIKPDNILFAKGKVKIADFGLAKHGALAGPQRAKNSFYKTHGAPELYRGAEIDRSTDVFAAGMTLFRLVNNIVDWHGMVCGLPNCDEMTMTGALVEKIGFKPEVPRSIRRIISKACAADPANRFKNCADFRNALTKLKFRSVWRPLERSEWLSDQVGNEEWLGVTKIRDGWELTYKVNGRRKSSLCSAFPTYAEAERAQLRFMYDRTLA